MPNSQKPKSTPPSKGGVSRQGRGGWQHSNQSSPETLSTTHIPLSEVEFDNPKGVAKNLPLTKAETKKNPKSRINNLLRLQPRRKSLRNNLTPAEARFWKILQSKNFEGRKFRRQHSVGNYVLDFYCPAEKLAIELDGEVHLSDAARAYDCKRRLYLQSCGIRVLRFENKLVFEDLEWVLGVIKNNFGWNGGG